MSGNPECLQESVTIVKNLGSPETPLVSILMGVFNCEDTVGEAIESIIGQTYTCWELIICDDGSSDSTLSIVRAFESREPRIVVLHHSDNRGLAPTLNDCLSRASGSLIARMDGDDISMPTRIERQVQTLRNDPTVAIVSTAMDLFDEIGSWGQTRPSPQPSPSDLLHGSPFAHAPMMMHRVALDSVNGYSESPRHWRVEDYHLWLKLLAAGRRGVNIPEPLYRMRNDREAAARRTIRARINEARLICDIVRVLGLPRWHYVSALRPLILSLLPQALYVALHRWRRRMPRL